MGYYSNPSTGNLQAAHIRRNSNSGPTMMDYQVTRMANRVIRVNFDRRLDLCMCFLRVQEFYESPKFRGKYFTVAEFVDWYSTNFGEGVFTYIADWDGFNVPSSTINKFYTLLSDNNGERNNFDLQLISICEKIEQDYKIDRSPYYLIGTHSEDDEGNITLDHEISHALYSLNRRYRREVNKLIDQLPEEQVTAKMYKVLTDYGYHKAVHKDELQAYFATGRDGRMMRFSRLRHTKPFKVLYNAYKKQLID